VIFLKGDYKFTFINTDIYTVTAPPVQKQILIIFLSASIWKEREFQQAFKTGKHNLWSPVDYKHIIYPRKRHHKFSQNP